MPRRNRTFKLDDRVLDALERLAANAHTSSNRYLENLLLNHAKDKGELSGDTLPLGDGRGGKRDNAGRRRKDGDDL